MPTLIHDYLNVVKLRSRPMDYAIRVAFALLKHRDVWCQGARARDLDGYPVRPTDPCAAKWDMSGAVAAASNSAGVCPPGTLMFLDECAAAVSAQFKLYDPYTGDLLATCCDLNDYAGYDAVIATLRFAAQKLDGGTH